MSIQTVDATVMFAVVVLLMILGVSIVVLAELTRACVLRSWHDGAA